jgi:hypothetical protein
VFDPLEQLETVLNESTDLPVVLSTINDLRQCKKTFRKQGSMPSHILVVFKQVQTRVEEVASYCKELVDVALFDLGWPQLPRDLASKLLRGLLFKDHGSVVSDVNCLLEEVLVLLE